MAYNNLPSTTVQACDVEAPESEMIYTDIKIRKRDRVKPLGGYSTFGKTVWNFEIIVVFTNFEL
jgi:hypothetical protein